jgi:hypothetical protein
LVLGCVSEEAAQPMAHFRGVLKKNDLEGGFWELHTDDGKRYQVAGGDDELRTEGARVEIEGKVDKAAFGIGMTGPILQVTSYRWLVE